MLYLYIKIHCYGTRRKENRKSVRNYRTLHNHSARRGHLARFLNRRAIQIFRKGNTTIRYPTSGKGYSSPLITAQIICNPLHFALWRVFLSLPNKSDKEYGTSKSPTTLHYLRCRNTRYDDSYLGNTRNYLLLQTQRIQVPNESRS